MSSEVLGSLRPTSSSTFFRDGDARGHGMSRFTVLVFDSGLHPLVFPWALGISVSALIFWYMLKISMGK